MPFPGAWRPPLHPVPPPSPSLTNGNFMNRNLLASTAAIVLAILAGAGNAAGYKVQSINSPGPAIRMNGNGAVTGFFDGKGVTKLTNKFGNNANAQAVALNASLELVGADVNGAWLFSGGAVI